MKKHLKINRIKKWKRFLFGGFIVLVFLSISLILLDIISVLGDDSSEGGLGTQGINQFELRFLVLYLLGFVSLFLFISFIWLYVSEKLL